MDISNLINRLNNELDKLNKLRNNDIDTRSFFTDNQHFNDEHEDYIKNLEEKSQDGNAQSENITEASNNNYQDITPDNETKSLVVVTKNYLATAQTMFKKTIKFSLKSFLISISLSFLNLFV